MASIYYSSESSDSENHQEALSLDLSYLMLDTESIAVHLAACVQERNKCNESNVASVYFQSKNNCLTSAKGAEKVIAHSSQMYLKDSDAKSENDLHESWVVEHLTNLNISPKDNTNCDSVTEKLFLQHNLLLCLPFEIALFSKLTMLDLSNNNLTHINDFLLQLPELKTLYIKNNNLGDDSLPKDMSSLTKLWEVNFSGNNLTRVPIQLFALSGLRYLYLGNNEITEVSSEIKGMQSLQVLHLGGNKLETVPNELADLHQLSALVLCDNRLSSLPRAISCLTRLRSLLLHKNNICCLPVEIVKLRGLMELSLRDNPLVTKFVNSCAKDIMYNSPTLLELAARVIKLKKIPYEIYDLPVTLDHYLNSGHRCVNPKCKGMYFSSCVEHIKFVDFCGVYRVPLMHYLCSSRCSSKTPSYYSQVSSDSDSDEEKLDVNKMRKVLLG